MTFWDVLKFAIEPANRDQRFTCFTALVISLQGYTLTNRLPCLLYGFICMAVCLFHNQWSPSAYLTNYHNTLIKSSVMHFGILIFDHVILVIIYKFYILGLYSLRDMSRVICSVCIIRIEKCMCTKDCVYEHVTMTNVTSTYNLVSPNNYIYIA